MYFPWPPVVCLKVLLAFCKANKNFQELIKTKEIAISADSQAL
jgi:hypothetical protein